MVKAKDLRLSLTPIELDCARVIQEFIAVQGRSPSLAEIAGELDMRSRSGAHKLVTNLRVKGWLTRTGAGNRYSLRLTAPVPMPVTFIDARIVADIAAEAISQLKRIMGNCGIALTLEERLIAAVSGDVAVELTDAGKAASAPADANAGAAE